MAKVSAKMPDDFLKKLSLLGEKTDEITKKVLEAGGNVVLEKTKNNLERVVGHNTKNKSRSTGILVSSLGVSQVLIDSKGNSNIKIGFSENRSDGVSNAMLANIIEYGKSNQPAKPFLAPAKKEGRKEMVEVMTKTLESEIDNL